MAEADTIEISRSMAMKIVDLLKEELKRLDNELQHGRTNRVGESALSILRDRRVTLRAIYDELKAVGVEGMDSTIDMLEPPGAPFGR
jgi:uncharacterized protein (DUF1499 family)